MCYTVQTSINAFIINVIISIYLYYSAFRYNKIPIIMASELKVIAIFLLFVGGMQFWDAIFWSTKETSTLNIFATKAAMIWNHLEPIVLALSIIYILNKKLPQLSKTILTLYTIGIILYTVNGWSTLTGTGKTPDSKDSLYWEWNNFSGAQFIYFLFLICLVILFYENFTGWIKWTNIILTLTSFFFSVYKYNIVESSGRFWCYFVAFAPLIYLGMM